MDDRDEGVAEEGSVMVVGIAEEDDWDGIGVDVGIDDVDAGDVEPPKVNSVPSGICRGMSVMYLGK